jgi:periplasmic copper chaperone A
MRLIALAAAGLLAGSAHAADRSQDLVAANPWSRPAAAGTTGAGFLTLVNGGKAAAVLAGAESPLAARVEIHESRMDGGVMRMSRVQRLAIPSGDRTVFAPGGKHLMLVGLRQALKVGDRVPVTLSFADGRKLSVTLPVGNGQPPAPGDHMHH